MEVIATAPAARTTASDAEEKSSRPLLLGAGGITHASVCSLLLPAEAEASERSALLDRECRIRHPRRPQRGGNQRSRSAPFSCTLRLEDDIDITRGNMICPADA